MPVVTKVGSAAGAASSRSPRRAAARCVPVRARAAPPLRLACGRRRRGATRSAALGRRARARRSRRPPGRAERRRARPFGQANVVVDLERRGLGLSRAVTRAAARPTRGRGGGCGSPLRRSAPDRRAARHATGRTGRPPARARAPRPARDRRAALRGRRTAAPPAARAGGAPRSGGAVHPLRRSQFDRNLSRSKK